MRRADPSPDGDGAPLPAYADSDVGSSPRSVGGFAGGRTGGGPTDETLPGMKWDDARVKLMCSYGGRIFPRPHDNQLRYVGGDSRIAVVSRNITFSELTAKLSRMFGCPVIIKYQLPYEDLDALISVTSDEDLENMMEEYDRLQSTAHHSLGNRPSAAARLRLFLFPSLDRSQTASLSEMMENTHSRERWFVDILNGLPVPSRVRSETSSIVSETPDCAFPSNMDTLEEWAAAASYGNSVPSTTELFTDNKHGNPVSPATLFGSLVQQVTPSEAASAPGSPSPLKPKPTATGSSSSAPPAVLSVISSIVDAASKGLPTKPMDSDGVIDNFSSKIHLGSADSSGSIPEQRKHVDSEILLSFDKNVLSSSVGGAQQLLPAGSMDDDDTSQKYLSKGSFDEVSESSEAAVFDSGLHQMMTEVSKTFKGDLVSETAALTGQPIFDDDLPPTHAVARNVNVLQGEEGGLSPKMVSPLSMSSASAPLMPSVLKPELVGPKFGSDERLKHHGFPVSPRAGVQAIGEDNLAQQTLPQPALNVMPTTRRDVDDGSSRHTPPSLAHFLPSLIIPQQPSTSVAGEDMVLPQILGTNATKDTESVQRLQGATIMVSAVTSPSFVPAPVPQEKLPLAPGPNYNYQQPSTQGLEASFSTVAQVTQAPPSQLPYSSQVATPVIGMVLKPSPPVPVPVRPTNVMAGARPATGMSRPQSPPIAVPQQAPPLIPQVRTTSPSIPMGPPMLVSNVSQLDTLKGNAPVSSNVVSSVLSTAVSSRGEGIGVRGSPYPQGDIVNIQRQGWDAMHGQRAAMAPPLGTQFNVANVAAPHAPGMPTRFRAVGHPLQQVAEGVPIQQTAMAALISDKKVPSPMIRGAPSPSSRPLPVPGGQYSYASAAPQVPGGLGGSPRYYTPSNVILGVPATSSDVSGFTVANPFVDDFQAASVYQDATEGSLADQNQRYPVRQG